MPRTFYPIRAIWKAPTRSKVEGKPVFKAYGYGEGLLPIFAVRLGRFK